MKIRRMKPGIAGMAAALAALLAGAFLAGGQSAWAQTKVRVGWCARTVSSAAAPYAIATKMGWYAKSGITVQLVPLPGSTDCVKLVATKDLDVSLPSVEPVAVIHTQGAKIRVFYTAYQANIYGFRVPEDSPIKTLADLRGKKIGVTSMASAGVIIARAVAAANGMDPDKDIQIVVAGEGAQTAALLRGKQVDALSQFDTQYALVENAGVALRALPTKDIDSFPSNGFVALEDSMPAKKKELVALAQGYAMGTIFALNNPEAAIRILWEVYPQTRATGKDEATALRDDIKTLMARGLSWRLESVGAKRWGENLEPNYEAYMKFLVKNGIVKDYVPGKDVITNAWIDEINKFDAKAVAAEAKAYKYK
jgi:NitT/TauT family transport system substrate-binding protein